MFYKVGNIKHSVFEWCPELNYIYFGPTFNQRLDSYLNHLNKLTHLTLNTEFNNGVNIINDVDIGYPLEDSLIGLPLKQLFLWK